MLSKMLIIGGSGLIGSTLVSYALSKYSIHVTVHEEQFAVDNIPSTQINLMKERSKIIDLIKDLKPNVVVHTAAHPSVDLCEIDHEKADLLG